MDGISPAIWDFLFFTDIVIIIWLIAGIFTLILERTPRELSKETTASENISSIIDVDQNAIRKSYPAQNNGIGTIEIIIIVFLIIISLYWLGIGLFQIRSLGVNHYANNVRNLDYVADWNIIFSISNLFFIRTVLKHKKQAVSGITFLVITGVIWGTVMFFLYSFLAQICAIPLYIALGVLVQINKRRFV